MTYYFMIILMPITLMLGCMVVFSSNVVWGAFCLALTCACLAFFIICFGNALIGTIILVVYPGAIAIIFLITVMMLSSKDRFIEKIGLFDVFAFISVALLATGLIILASSKAWHINENIDTTLILYDIFLKPGKSLYIQYNGELQLVAIILLAAILGITNISYIFQPINHVKKIPISEYASDNPKNNVQLVRGRKSV